VLLNAKSLFQLVSEIDLNHQSKPMIANSYRLNQIKFNSSSKPSMSRQNGNNGRANEDKNEIFRAAEQMAELLERTENLQNETKEIQKRESFERDQLIELLARTNAKLMADEQKELRRSRLEENKGCNCQRYRPTPK
jgi:hypothetical protein